MRGAPANSVLVTGASGFLGGHLVRRLVAEGRQVTALLRRPEAADLPDAVRRVAWPTDQDALREVVADASADACVHLASHFVAEHASPDIAPLVHGNVGLTTAVADAATAAGMRRLVFAGTVWQNASGRVYDPLSLYAATKQAAQDILRHFAQVGLPVVVLRLPDTYGPGDPRRKVLDVLLGAAADGERLGMSGGQQLVDLLHVEDVVQALLVALDRPCDETWAEFALSSGRPLTLRQLAEVVSHVTGAPVDVAWGQRPYRRREAFQPWDAGASLPGWSPAISLEDGVRALWHARAA